MKKITILICITILVGFYYIVSYSYQHPCIKSHVESVHHDRYSTVIYAGKAFIPVTYPERYSEETVCDKYK